MDVALRQSRISANFTSAALALAAVIDLFQARSASGFGSLYYLTAFVPLLLVVVLNRRGGWIGAGISNLKLRPDIGLGWMFKLPSVRRWQQANLAFSALYLIFLVARLNWMTPGPDLVRSWFAVSGIVYLVLAAFQSAGYWVFGRHAGRETKARLTVPPPWAAGGAAPQRDSAAGIADIVKQ